MSKFLVISILLLILLILGHILYSIDYTNLFSTTNKGGATGIMVAILGIVSLLLAQKADKKMRLINRSLN